MATLRIFVVFCFLLAGGRFISAGEGPFVTDRIVRLKDGRNLCYREIGNPDGKLVLYFHGVNSSRLEAEFIRNAVMKSGLRLISIDRPGLGGSTFCRKRTICSWVNDVEELIDAIGCSDQGFGIFAESGGAAYGCVCAARMPRRVSHLAIVSGYAPLDTPGVEAGALDTVIRLVARHPNIGKAIAETNERKIHRNPQMVIKALTRKWAAVDRKHIIEDERTYRVAVANLKNTWSQGGDGSVMEVELLRNHWGFEISDIKSVPVSIWCGDADTIVTTSMAYYFHRQIAGSSLTFGPKEGHATMSQNYASAILKRF